MPLTEDDNERLTLMLQNLQGVLSKIYPNARQFVQDQIDRHEKYGDHIYMSDKQWSWLESLHGEYCSGAPVETRDAPGADDPAPDLNDENPY